MRSLKTLQHNLQEYMLNQQTTIFTDVISTTEVTSTTRLDIYRDGYFLRLLDVLINDYPVLKKLIGDDKFIELGTDYIKTTPSTFRSVRWFGKEFSSFLRAQKNFPLLQVELTHFEWSLTEAFDAADIPTIDLATMAAVRAQQWPEMTFKLHPSVRRLDLQWNVVKLWHQAQEEKPLRPRQQKKLMHWVIYRHHHDVQFYSLPPAEAYMLDAMLAQINFADICEGLCQWIDTKVAATMAASVLKRFIQDGMISDVILQ